MKFLNRLLLVVGILMVFGGMLWGAWLTVFARSGRRVQAAAKEATVPMPPLESPCNTELNKRVWYPPRLKTARPCITVTGWVRKRSAEPDGDWHYHLAVDSPNEKNYPDLLNDANRQRLQGTLVFEMVCMGNVRQESAEGVCNGYVPPRDRTDIPRVGDYVAVHGPLVLDTSHGWMEIHPAEVQVLRATPDKRKRENRRTHRRK